jgi:hypothetical protein
MGSEWVEWHRQYEVESPLEDRLKVVQGLIREELDRRPPGRIHVISLCSGDGRDFIGAILGHSRRRDVTARLADLDPDLVSLGRERVRSEGLSGVEFDQADAGLSRTFKNSVPADIILACGIYGNISDRDVRNTIRHLSELCAPEALVIWTRGRFEPDLTPAIRGWFRDASFDEVAFVLIPNSTMSVGAHRLRSTPADYDPSTRLFTFLPPGQRPADLARARRERP